MSEQADINGSEKGDAAYTVGPGRPPREHQFAKGQSGNPGGRPKGESITALIRKVLEQEHNGKKLAELVAERIVKEALSGKLGFAKELIDRIDGRAPERGEDQPQGGLTIVIQRRSDRQPRPGEPQQVRPVALLPPGSG